MPPPTRGLAYTYQRALLSAAGGGFQVNPTLAAGDFQISKDGGAFVNLVTLPVVSPAGSRQVQIALTAAEMTAERVTVQAIDQVGGEWTDYFESFDTWPLALANVPAAVWDELLSGHSILGSAGATLSTILGLLDTEVAAILAKVTPLTFTTPGKVDAALQAASDLATAVGQKVADIVLRRVATEIEASAEGSALHTASLYGLIQRAEHADTTTFPGQYTIFRTNGTTILGQIPLAFDDTAQDITGFGD
jgi:hypothetical protein